MAFLVSSLQKSSKPSPCLSVNDQPTCIADKQIQVSHKADAVALNLRAYIDTLLPTLKCSMDVQTSDGRGMVLKYVSSYVSKWIHKDYILWI